MEIALTLLITVAAMVLFALGRWGPDLVALMVLAALLLTGLVAPDQAFTGFSNRATITVAAMFILSAGLVKTGAVNVFGEKIIELAADREWLLVMMLMTVVGIISAFINNTAAVAVFLPITLRIARQARISPSKLLIPLSFAGIFGGTMTLIGTSTNLLVHSIAIDAGYGGFDMFEMTPLGVLMLLAGVVYMVVIGRQLVPARRPPGDPVDSYRVREYLAEMVVPADSPLVGTSPVAVDEFQERDVRVLGMFKGDQAIWTGLRDTVIETDDRLILEGPIVHVLAMRQLGLLASPVPSDPTAGQGIQRGEAGVVEGVISPNSVLVDSTIEEVRFRQRYGVTVLAVRSHGETTYEQLKRRRLRFGDTLLLQGPRDRLEQLKGSPDFMLLAELAIPTYRRAMAPLALGIVGIVVAAASLNIMPIDVAAVAGAVVMVLAGILTRQEAYDSMDWTVIFLLGGIIPLGIAMEASGTAVWLAGGLLQHLEPFGPVAVVAGLYILTTLLSNLISNNATALLIAPIAISMGEAMGINVRSLLVTVMFASSASFITPIGYQTNTMVYGAGEYRFFDYTRVGAPLNLFLVVMAALLIPIFWPL